MPCRVRGDQTGTRAGTGQVSDRAGGRGRGRVSTAFQPHPPPRRALAGSRGRLGAQWGSARGDPPKGSRPQTHPREKRPGLGLTLLPGQRPGSTKYTTPFLRGARARGPERGAPVPSARRAGAGVRAERSPEPLTRSGAWPPRRAARPWSRRAGGAGGALAPRVRRSKPPPPPSFTFSAPTHRPPSRAGGGQRRGRDDGRGWNRPARAGARAARGGAGAGRGRRE